MPKFLVAVSGKLLVDAEDKDEAKKVVTGILADRQAWLTVGYGEAEKIGETKDVPLESLVAVS